MQERFRFAAAYPYLAVPDPYEASLGKRPRAIIIGGKNMFEVTEEASRVLRDFLTKQKSNQAIRILLQAG